MFISAMTIKEKRIALFIFNNFLLHFCWCSLDLKVFKESSASTEGFLFKKIPNENNQSLPIIFKRISNNALRSICIELNYLGFHALHYPKQLSEKQNFIIPNCGKLLCQLSVKKKVTFNFFS